MIAFYSTSLFFTVSWHWIAGGREFTIAFASCSAPECSNISCLMKFPIGRVYSEYGSPDTQLPAHLCAIHYPGLRTSGKDLDPIECPCQLPCMLMPLHPATWNPPVFATVVISVRLRINQRKDRLWRWKFDSALCNHVYTCNSFMYVSIGIWNVSEVATVWVQLATGTEWSTPPCLFWWLKREKTSLQAHTSSILDQLRRLPVSD